MRLGAEVSRFALQGSGRRFNAALAIVGGALLPTANVLAHPLIVLPYLVATMTGSLAAVAWVPAIIAIGWFAPQLLSGLLGSLPVRRRFLVAASLGIRALALGVMAIDAGNPDLADDDRLRRLLLWYAVAALASGCAADPGRQALQRAFAGSGLEAVLRSRHLATLIMIMIAGLATRSVFAMNDRAVNDLAFVLFTAACFTTAASAYFALRLREPYMTVLAAERPAPFAEMTAALRNPRLRRYLLAGLLATLASSAEPFFIIIAVRELAAPRSLLGDAVLWSSFCFVVSTPVWIQIQRRWGNRPLLQLATLLRAAMPLLAFAIPSIVTASVYRDRISDPRVEQFLIVAVFALGGAAAAASARGAQAYLADISTDPGAPGPALATGLLAIPAVAGPFIAAGIYASHGSERMLLISAAVGLVAVLASGVLAPTAIRSQRGPF